MALEFPIITTFDNKGANLADKTFKKLAGTFAAAFSTRAVVNFASESIKAFTESEKAAKRLSIQLQSVNLGFAAPYVKQYVSQAALATGVSENQLIPAFQKLSAVTGDVLKAQELLNLSLDVSLSTGSDLESTAIALSKAYVGNAEALKKLNIGITDLDVKGKSADDILGMLQTKYGNKGKQAVDDFAGAWSRLAVAVEQAKVQFGKGFVEGLQTTGVEVEKLQNDVINLGNAFGYAAGKSVGFLDSLMQDVARQIMTGKDPISEFLRSQLNFNYAPSRGGAPGAGKLARENQIALQKQQAEQKRLAALQSKAAKDALAKEKASQQLKRAGTVFDMENIQIVAALQGKVSEEQRLRLVALLAINNENADAADKLTSAILALEAPALKALGVTITTSDNATTVVTKLINAQTQLLLLNAGIANIPKAKNPFEDWDAVMKSILANLDAISKKITGMPNINTGGGAPQPSGGNGGNSGTGGSNSGNSGTPNTTDVPITPKPILIPPNGSAPIFPPYVPPTPKPGTMPLAAMSGYGTAQIPTGIMPLGAFSGYGTTNGINIVVNVAGNVTTESDLVQTITDQLYNFQRGGGQILLSSLAV